MMPVWRRVLLGILGILGMLHIVRQGDRCNDHQRDSTTIWRRPALYVGLVILTLVAALVMWPRENVFTLDVSTEVAAFTVTDPILSEWDVAAARLIEDPFTDVTQARKLGEHAHLIITPGARVEVQRHGVHTVRIQLTNDAQTSVGRIEQATESMELGDWALVLVEPDDRPLVLPFRGTLAAGDDVAAGVNSILLAGTVSVVEAQLLGNTHYIAGAETLDTGDRVRLLFDASGNDEMPEPATVSGFVRAEPMSGFSNPFNALTLVAHGQADYVKVERLGSAGYEVHAPPWARFLHDPFLAAATAIVALFVLLIELVSKCGALTPLSRESETANSEAGTKTPPTSPGDSNEKR